jgi:hypothetical protein
MSQLSHGQSQVSSSLQSYEQPEEDDVGPLLPATVFGQKPAHVPARAASAPPEKMNPVVHHAYNPGLPGTRRLSVGRGGQIRKISPPEVNHGMPPQPGISSIDEALHSDIVIVADEEEEPVPIMLPELQHLAGPPPPPPPPTMFSQDDRSASDMINIAIDSNPSDPVDAGAILLPSTTFNPAVYPQPMERATTASPSMHRRGRGSVSESFGSRFRGVTDRMRSQSRSRAKSPPVPSGAVPYETVLPPMPTHHHPHARSSSISRAKSPYEQAMSAGGQDQQIPPPPPPAPMPPLAGMEGKISETAIPPTHLPQSRSASTTGYRNPKDIRANMPPETLQQGVYNGGFL